MHSVFKTLVKERLREMPTVLQSQRPRKKSKHNISFLNLHRHLSVSLGILSVIVTLDGVSLLQVVIKISQSTVSLVCKTATPNEH